MFGIVINEMNKVEKKKMIDIKSYQEGFMDGIGYKDDYKIRLLGYDLTELLKIVDNYSMEKKKMPTKAKMTRAEAIACLDKHNPHNYNTSHMIDFYIEAGMLEIVEETTTTVFETDNDIGKIRLEKWPEGYVLWCGGVIRWKQWA